MIRRLAILIVVALAVAPAGVRAEHFDMFVSLRTTEGAEARSSWDTEPPAGGVNERPALRARAGEPITAEWLMRSAYPHGVMKGVIVRFYVVREDAVRQKELPPRETPRVVESEFTMDFLPDFATKGMLIFRVDQPGAYLVRMESKETLAGHGHEHFSALDLVVE